MKDMTDSEEGAIGGPLVPGVPDQMIGLILAISSSIFIGSSFIVKKRGLRVAASSGHLRAGAVVCVARQCKHG